MAKASIKYEPDILNLVLYAGDGCKFKITLKDKTGHVVPITGTMIAQIRSAREAVDPPKAEFDIDLTDAANGVAIVSLTGIQTHALIVSGAPFEGVWDCQWTATGEEPRTLCQGEVECQPDVSH